MRVTIAADSIAAYEEHVEDVYGYLAYRSGSRQTAEDLTVKVFERGRRGSASSDPEDGQSRAWLMTIARSVYVDSRRRGPSPNVTGESEGSAGSGPECGVAYALRRLERREREAIALRFGGDLRVAEIAEVLGVSVSSAQQILSRALRRLCGMLDD